ncbi:MAG: aminoglycoside phosphotransferase family protein [bacterium]|nr:aminoglycoside phosphotransferase family protein [bacterium]
MSELVSPQEITSAFYPEGIEQETVLAGGIVNTTLLVTDAAKQRSILQRLSPIFDESMAEDFDAVSEHLLTEGWEVARAVKSTSGRSYISDLNGGLWRSFTFIESDGNLPAVGFESSVALSGLLGALHNSLSRLDYTPRFSLPHFHETAYYADKLESLLPKISNADAQNLAMQAIIITRKQAIPQEPAQLIHGDPKMTNALYRDGVPFTFIDFDTLMKGNPLVDVGDMLRSVTGKMVVKNPNFSPSDIEPVIEAYYEQAKPNVDEERFVQQALNAGQVIALELGIRYLIDSVEDSYFDWDREQFDSRRSHNIVRAEAQWQTYEALG